MSATPRHDRAPALRDWRDLAIFGGEPRFERALHVNKPNAPDRDRLFARLDAMLERRWFSNGALVHEFEAEVSRITGTRHCIATCNGTMALEIGARSLGLAGEVIVPSFTYFATAQALRWLGITPVYCDVDPATHNIDPDHAERLITPRTSGILGVHLWGTACDVDRLQDIADRHGVRLLFDAAQAFGSTFRGRPVGGFGALETFSFHATKFVNTSEGGAITTNDDEVAARCRAARDLGFDDQDRIIGPGTNGKLSELCAAMGLTYIERFDELVAANGETAERYRRGLQDVPGIAFFDAAEPGTTNRQYVVTIVDPAAAGLSRDALLRILEAERVLAKPYFHPGCHVLDREHPAAVRLPVTEQLAATTLVLPGGASVTGAEIDGVCELIRLAVAHAGAISTADSARS